MQKVLITGGTGFLGSHLVKRLLDREEVDYIVIPSTRIRENTSLKFLALESSKIHLIDGDIRDYDFVQRMFNEYEFDTVFHLGALTEVRKCQSNAKLAFETNINGTVNILETARLQGGVNAIIVSSSDKAYGKGTLPYEETQPLRGDGVYEVSKSCTDLIAKSYFYNYELPVVVTRCSNLYGGGDSNFSRIVPNTIKHIFENRRPVVWSGAQNFIREYLYVEDAVDAYLSLAENIKKTKGEAYNIGSGDKITVIDLVYKIIDKMSSGLAAVIKDRNFPEINNQYLDSSKIKRDTGWEPKTSLDDGLDKTIKIYREILK